MKRVWLVVVGLTVGFALLAGCSTAAPISSGQPKDAPEETGPASAAPVELNAPPEAGAPPAGTLPVSELLETRTDTQGAVEVIVAPQFGKAGGPWLDFKVTLDTHSVELDYDLAALAELRTDTGVILTPVKWDAPSGGHHVEGLLSFPAQVDGKPALDGVKQLSLTIRDLDAPLRPFIWEW